MLKANVFCPLALKHCLESKVIFMLFMGKAPKYSLISRGVSGIKHYVFLAFSKAFPTVMMLPVMFDWVLEKEGN